MSKAGPAPAAGAPCKTTPTPVQTATVTEADLGVPFYPGAKLDGGAVSSGPDGSSASANLVTTDPPEKVLAFYRERLKALAAGRELADGGSKVDDKVGNHMLELATVVGKPGIQLVTSGSSEQGTILMIGIQCVVK